MLRQMLAALCAAVSLTVCSVPAVAEAVEVSATAVVLLDADSGQVLYEKNGDRRMLIASTTKLLTALVALEQGELTQEITITAEHMAEGSSMYLRAGETWTLETLLYGLLLSSGNDAALAVTECMGGIEPFVAQMNELAGALGMADSHFMNPHGLDEDGHYSTARDMARLAAAAAEQPTLRRIASTITAQTGGRALTNHNKLLRRVEGCIGFKTGYTMAAGRTLVSCAEREGVRLVAVTLQDGDDWNDHEALYDWGFRVLLPMRAVERTVTQAVSAALRGEREGGMTP